MEFKKTGASISTKTRDVNEFFKNRLSPAEQGEFNENVLRNKLTIQKYTF